MDTAWALRGQCVKTACNVRVVHVHCTRVMLQSLRPVLYIRKLFQKKVNHPTKVNKSGRKMLFLGQTRAQLERGLSNVTLFGKTRLNENSVIMHFQCIFNALIMHYNVLIMVFNAFLMLISPLKKRWQCSTNIEEWMKNVSKCVGNFFQRLIQMLHKTLKTKDNVLPCSNKAPHATNSTEHHNSASERIWFWNVNKEQFAATYIKTFAKQQLPWSQRFFLIFVRLRWESRETAITNREAVRKKNFLAASRIIRDLKQTLEAVRWRRRWPRGSGLRPPPLGTKLEQLSWRRSGGDRRLFRLRLRW